MFLSRLILSDHPTPGLWVVYRPLIWQEPDGTKIVVPSGFLTDLASIPAALGTIPFLRVDGRTRRPGVLHDWLYSEQSRGKPFADNLLAHACVSEGMLAVEAGTIYQAVHSFGGTPWGSNRRAGLASKFVLKSDYEAWNSSKNT